MNLVLWTSHDSGTSFGPYGDRSVPTPQFDRLAAGGTTFTEHYSTCPICSPSRGALQTGRYPHVNGLMGLVNLGWDLPADQTCLVQQLAAAGYHTSLVGFQHIRRETESLGYVQHFAEVARAAPAGHQVAELLANPPAAPFYLEVNTHESHRPWGEDDGSVDPSRVTVPPYWPDCDLVRGDLAGFYRHIAALDAGVGTVLDALEQTAAGRDTLFVFTTDHGRPFPRAKSTLYDSGLRIALQMRGPGLPEGATCRAMSSNIDLNPTLCELLGVPRPQRIDGRSFAAQARGESRQAHRQWILAEQNWQDDYDPMRCVRTERWKYIRNLRPGPQLTLAIGHTPARCPTARALNNSYLAPRPDEELYDIQEDPHELHNLADDPTLASTLRNLREILDDWQAGTDDPFCELGYVPAPPENYAASRRGLQWWPGEDA